MEQTAVVWDIYDENRDEPWIARVYKGSDVWTVVVFNDDDEEFVLKEVEKEIYSKGLDKEGISVWLAGHKQSLFYGEVPEEFC
ncbi:hypothetical protein [Desulfurobacterium sp.]